MHSRLFCARVACALFLIIVLSVRGVAEQTLTVEVDLVNLYFTVCNRKGHPVANLERDRFAVLEDGTPQLITHFSRESDEVMTLALIIDTSGSVRDKLAFEQRAAIDFVRTLATHTRYRAAVLTFDSAIELKQDYTDDPELLASSLRKTIAGGGTRFYDALSYALSEKLGGPELRKAAIVLSDGADNVSSSSLNDVIRTAQLNNVMIYAISVNGLGLNWVDSEASDRILQRLAAETGGKAYFPKKLKALPADFTAIGNELRAQYSLAYKSTNPERDGAFRSVRIDVKNSNYSVRTRTGYYAPRMQAR